MMYKLYELLFFAISVYAVTKILPGIRIKGFKTALLVSVVYSIVHFFMFWFLVFISFIPVALSFGLFIFVINAFLLFITDKLIQDFEINHFGTTIVASVLITISSNLLHWIFL